MNLHVNATTARNRNGSWHVYIDGRLAGTRPTQPKFCVIRRTRSGWALIHLAETEARAVSFRNSYRLSPAEKIHVVAVDSVSSDL